MVGRLQGKICIITGTGGAIGRASALAFAREGATIVGCDIIPETATATDRAVAEAGGQIATLAPCDLATLNDCERLVELALERCGRIDVLFNNASRPTYGALTEDSNDHWFRTIDNELHMVYLLCKAAWPALSASGGTIVNMASAAGWTTFPALAGLAHGAAKGGVISMTRHLAMEGRDLGIRANSISPGVIGTPKVLGLAENPDWDRLMRSKIMRGSYGKPEEIAAVALFFASDESAFVNAADIRADGGITAW